MKKSRMLSVFLLTALLVSCGETASPSETTAPTGDTSANETAAPYEVRDLGGREFVILAREAEGGYPCEFLAEEETGDVLNDAIYQRNRAVEEALNVKIGVLTGTRQNMGSEALTYIMSGDHLFDIGLINYLAISTLLPADGALIPLNDIDTLDLSAKWWDSTSLDAFRLTENTYLAAGTINLNASTAIYGLLFNQTIVDNYKLTSPYELVESGKWTMDEMFSMMQLAEEDVNGDSIMDDADQHGLIASVNSFQYLFYHAGEEIVKRDSDGVLTINKAQRVYDVVDKILPVNGMYYLHGDGNTPTLNKYFANGNALFYQTSLQSTMDLRAMTSDYGIIPGPKADASQDRYYSPLAASFASLVSIPATNPDPEAAGILLNALGYYSDQILMPALYESVLPAKLARDEASTRMIDIMNDSKMYVINAAFNFGKSNNLYKSVQSAGSNTMASELASYESAIEAAITDLMAKLK